MQTGDKDVSQTVKPDLKHDTMEFNAATDGDDVLSTDTESAMEVEDEEISAEELELLEDDSVDSQAQALVTAETDSLADEDNFINEEGEDDELFEEQKDSEQPQEENIRK